MGKWLVHIYVYKTETFVRTKVTKAKVESLIGLCDAYGDIAAACAEARYRSACVRNTDMYCAHHQTVFVTQESSFLTLNMEQTTSAISCRGTNSWKDV